MHTCHATDCEKEVPSKLFMCHTHWYALTKAHRDAIWAAYRTGQEARKDPSPQYMQVAKLAIQYLENKYGTASSKK